ncbi:MULTISPECIES: lipoprotein [unclassified Thioalkalivibrio]|nr:MULTISPECIES: lipoprotein [unclassified Thioalkalivibrio]PYG03532.1 putative lipoprotein [Thioalkalivibrio sp. ALE21]
MSFCKAHLLLLIVVIVLGGAQMLASCGQKGDLYLPEDEQEESR